MILGLIIEFIFELVIQIVLEIGLLVGFESMGQVLRSKRELGITISITGFLLSGTLVGYLSMIIFPRGLVRQEEISGLSILFAPMIMGSLMELLGRKRRAQERATSYLATFWGGASFAFAVALVRWLMRSF